MAAKINQAQKNHNVLVESVRQKLPNEEEVTAIADLFKVFADPTRAKIMSCLGIRDLCVCDIAEILNMTISAVSHQLRVLRNSKLVKATKMGKEVMYSLDDDHVVKIFECGLSHINEKD